MSSRPTFGLLVLSLYFLELSSPQAVALETDQFMVWDLDLQDSTDRLNEFVNERFQVVLDRLDRQSASGLNCEDIPERVYRHIFPHLFYSRIRKFLAKDEALDRFPKNDVGYLKYLKRSIFRRPAFPFIMPMARSISVNEVNLGADKLGHMFGFGRRYYVRFRWALNRGKSPEEAVRMAIVWGHRLEGLTVGGLVDGVVSYADLEANYQGMLLARDLCEDQPPALIKSDGKWRLSKPINLRRYVNPAFDETYNSSYFTHWRWKQVQPIIQRDYCPAYRQSRVQGLMRSYASRDRGSLSREIIGQMESEQRLAEREQQSLESICPELDVEPTGGLELSPGEEDPR